MQKRQSVRTRCAYQLSLYPDRVIASGLRTTSRRELVVIGALLTVLAAVAIDLFSGETPLHAISVGVLAASATALRVRVAGRQRSLLQFVCGCVLSQPVLHHAAKILPHPNLEHGHGHVPGAADVFVAALQIVVVLAVIAILTFAEQILLALAIGAAHLCIVRIRALRPLPEWARFVVMVAPAAELLASRHYYPGSIARRGPPVPTPAF